MKNLQFNRLYRLLSAVLFTTAFFLLGACSPAEKQIALTLAQDAVGAANAKLSQLTQNKNLSEQFVHDVKNHLDTTDPQYERIMGHYEIARDLYNEYISQLQSSVKSGRSNSSAADSMDHLNSATAAFIGAAAKGLDPTITSRNVQFDRAIVLPTVDNSVKKLSLDARKLLADHVIAGMRWKPWSQI